MSAANVDSIVAELSRHIPPQPAHNLLNQHHVESQPARTVIGHYLDNAMTDQTQAILSGGGKYRSDGIRKISTVDSRRNYRSRCCRNNRRLYRIPDADDSAGCDPYPSSAQ